MNVRMLLSMFRHDRWPLGEILQAAEASFPCRFCHRITHPQCLRFGLPVPSKKTIPVFGWRFLPGSPDVLRRIT
jgi:hypothetical protein